MIKKYFKNRFDKEAKIDYQFFYDEAIRQIFYFPYILLVYSFIRVESWFFNFFNFSIEIKYFLIFLLIPLIIGSFRGLLDLFRYLITGEQV